MREKGRQTDSGNAATAAGREHDKMMHREGARFAYLLRLRELTLKPVVLRRKNFDGGAMMVGQQV